MNKKAIFHQVESNYCFPINQNTIELRIRFDKEDVIDNVKVIYGCKYEFYYKHNEIEMEYYVEDANYKYYRKVITLVDVRVAYVFKFTSENKDFYLSCDGVTETYNFKTSYYNFFQLAYINKKDIVHEVSWAKDAVIYEIFIDRFNTGKNNRNKDYVNLEWGEIPNPKSFAGGNIEGIIEKLDYLQDLGITCLYLTPIFESISNHKYDISDYYNISEQFGSKESLRKLIDECHMRNMKVVLDAVFNHISSLSPQFQDVLKNKKKSKYFDWFVIKGDEAISNPLNYEVFSICDYMPKLNTCNPEVVEFLCNVGKYYIEEFHIDGWRLDVSDEVSHDFWRTFRKELKSVNEDVMLIGENWQDGSSYLQGDQFDGIMNYSFSRIINDYFSFEKIDHKTFVYNLNNLLIRYNNQVTNTNWSMIDSHDSYRLYTQTKQNKDLCILAHACQIFFKGIPVIYYGDEIPLPGGYDPDCRRCFNWDKETFETHYFKTIKALINIRHNEIIKYGDLRIFEKNELVFFERCFNGNTIVLVINKNDKDMLLNYDNVILSSKKLNGKVIPKQSFIIF